MPHVVLATVTSDSPDRTIELAESIGGRLRAGDLLVLTGDLGAGKTHFTKGIARALGITESVTSPTFALHQRYEGTQILHHLDVYRLDDIAETLDLDLPELIDSGITVIEWGDTIDGVLPQQRLVVRIEADRDEDNARSISFEAADVGTDPWSDRLEGVFV